MKKLLEASDIAKLMGTWTPRRARRWMMRNGGSKRGGRWVITPRIIRDRFPGVFMTIRDCEHDLPETREI